MPIGIQIKAWLALPLVLAGAVVPGGTAIDLSGIRAPPFLVAHRQLIPRSPVVFGQRSLNMSVRAVGKPTTTRASYAHTTGDGPLNLSSPPRDRLATATTTKRCKQAHGGGSLAESVPPRGPRATAF